MRLQKEYVRLVAQKNNSFKEIPDIGKMVLKEGDVNEVVPLIAERLMNLGYLPRIEHAGSIYSSLSSDLLNAVNEFRRSNNMPLSNIIGSYTIGMLNRPLSYYKNI